MIYLDEVSSTNDYLKEKVNSEQVLEGCVVCADYQNGGKGQSGKSWESQSGLNALFSVYLQPSHLVANGLNALSFCVGLAVRAAVQHHLPQREVTIKWPNDVYVDDSKIAGILIENTLGTAPKSIVGIGINVKQSSFLVDRNVTSLHLEGVKSVEPLPLVNLCSEFIEKYYLLSKQPGGVQQIHTLYVSQLYKRNDTIIIDGKQSVVLGVDLMGNLTVHREGSQQSYGHNEAEIIWNS
jgi:BirA family biotin operon repressor/biotin-[acetyl-CoA-carboxylase] ligase